MEPFKPTFRRVNDLSLRIANSNLMVSLLHERKIENPRDTDINERNAPTDDGHHKECVGDTYQMEDDSSMDEEEMRRKLLERMRRMKEKKVMSGNTIPIEVNSKIHYYLSSEKSCNSIQEKIKDITFYERNEDLRTEENTAVEKDNGANYRMEEIINRKRNEDTEENMNNVRINAATDSTDSDEDTDSGIERVSEGDPLLSFASFRLCRGFPLRLLTHVGVTNNLDPLLPLCPFELMGKCKDVICEWQHAHDYRMSDRDILAMVLQYAPEIAEPRLTGLSAIWLYFPIIFPILYFRQKLQNYSFLTSYVDNSKSLCECGSLLVRAKTFRVIKSDAYFY
uniref:Zf-C3H1 domain-containing protein n=1 Tax=Heterorhabditis bacteriophora TaxID=37862 RepID=A0A1I7WLA4_HETBA